MLYIRTTGRAATVHVLLQPPEPGCPPPAGQEIKRKHTAGYRTMKYSQKLRQKREVNASRHWILDKHTVQQYNLQTMRKHVNKICNVQR